MHQSIRFEKNQQVGQPWAVGLAKKKKMLFAKRRGDGNKSHQTLPPSASHITNPPPGTGGGGAALFLVIRGPPCGVRRYPQKPQVEGVSWDAKKGRKSPIGKIPRPHESRFHWLPARPNWAAEIFHGFHPPCTWVWRGTLNYRSTLADSKLTLAEVGGVHP